jgi:hypothetical protein
MKQLKRQPQLPFGVQQRVGSHRGVHHGEPPLRRVKRMVPNLAKCEAEIAQKLGNFSLVILPLECDSFGPISQAIAH